MGNAMKQVKLWFQENLRLVIHKSPRLYRLCLGFVRDYGKWYYNKLDKRYHYKDALRKMRGSKKGQRCFVIGNGPSLRPEDLDQLVGEDCFGANKIFNIFPYTKWRPTYYTCVDWHPFNDDEIEKLQAELFLFGDYFWRKNDIKKFNEMNVVIFYGERLPNTKLSSVKFSEDISERVFLCATVTYASLQIAAFLGYKEIYLLGVDNDYPQNLNTSNNKIVNSPDVEKSHFYEDEGAIKIYGDIDGMTNAYIAAKRYADSHGFRIYNATRGGKLEVFERVDFDSLFPQTK